MASVAEYDGDSVRSRPHCNDSARTPRKDFDRRVLNCGVIHVFAGCARRFLLAGQVAALRLSRIRAEMSSSPSPSAINFA